MARVIKFRAWDKHNKQMLYDVQNEYDCILACFGQCLNLEDLSDNEYYSVMQFTGLCDKNGKEIYEGDILRFPTKTEWEKNNYYAFEVFYHDNDCCDNHVGFQMNRLHFFGNVCGAINYETRFKPEVTKKMEVIGNIYENTELLKGVD